MARVAARSRDCAGGGPGRRSPASGRAHYLSPPPEGCSERRRRGRGRVGPYFRRRPRLEGRVSPGAPGGGLLRHGNPGPCRRPAAAPAGCQHGGLPVKRAGASGDRGARRAQRDPGRRGAAAAPHGPHGLPAGGRAVRPKPLEQHSWRGGRPRGAASLHGAHAAGAHAQRGRGVGAAAPPRCGRPGSAARRRSGRPGQHPGKGGVPQRLGCGAGGRAARPGGHRGGHRRRPGGPAARGAALAAVPHGAGRRPVLPLVRRLQRGGGGSPGRGAPRGAHPRARALGGARRGGAVGGAPRPERPVGAAAGQLRAHDEAGRVRMHGGAPPAHALPPAPAPARSAVALFWGGS